QLGYAERVTDARDARRKLVRLTPLGIDALARSAAIFEDLRAQWASRLGPERLRPLEADLRTMAPHGRFRLDVPGWVAREGGPAPRVRPGTRAARHPRHRGPPGRICHRARGSGPD